MPAYALRVLAIVVGASAVATATLWGPPRPALAQTPPGVEIALVDQPIWHEPNDPLGIRLRVTNGSPTALSGFRLLVRIYDPADSRSQLHLDFDVDPTRPESSSLSIDEFLDREIAGGSSLVVDVTESTAALHSLASSTTSGVYPLTVTLTDAEGVAVLDSITTQVIYLPSEVETPLNVLPIWSITDHPSRGPRGAFEADPLTGAIPLEAALSTTGWLSGILDALTAPRVADELHGGLALTPRLVEEVDDMATGYSARGLGDDPRTVETGDPPARNAAEALQQIRNIVRDQTMEPILVPYSFPDLPTLVDFEQTHQQLTAAEAVYAEVLDLSAGRRWLFPPAGRVDEPTLARLRSSSAATGVLLTGDSLEPPPLDAPTRCREDFIGITYTCPVALDTVSGAMHGYVLDQELQRRFGALVETPRDAGARQRFFAETAMIWAELPGVAERVVPLSIPPLWHPPPWVAKKFVRGLVSAPWIKTRTPAEGLELGIDPADRELVPEATDVQTQPEDGYFDEVEEAARVVSSFGRVRPPAAMLERLQRNVLVAQSRLWWGEPAEITAGLRYATEAQAEVEEELAKVSIGGRKDITLTSRSGDLPLLLINDTDYNLTLEIHLDFSDRDLELTRRTIQGSFEPGASPLAVEATARSSGIYRVRVRVESPDGLAVHETPISIRSTQFNELALGITLGAFAFLVAFYVYRRLRPRSPTDDETSNG